MRYKVYEQSMLDEKITKERQYNEEHAYDAAVKWLKEFYPLMGKDDFYFDMGVEGPSMADRLVCDVAYMMGVWNHGNPEEAYAINDFVDLYIHVVKQ